MSGERILVHTPTGRDADLARGAIERAGWSVAVCANLAALCREVEHGAGLAIVGDEALTVPAVAKLARALERQPSWSDLPVIVLTRAGTPSALVDRAVPRMNVSLVERPTSVPVLHSAVRAALRARRRQYEVRDLIARLEAVDRTKAQFMAQLGHDLRTPLDALRKAVLLLERGSRPSSSAPLSVIDRQSLTLAGFLDELADMARIASGRLELRREPLDLSRVVAAASRPVEAGASARGVRIELALAPRPLIVEADAACLQQVVAMLLRCAVESTAAGGHTRATTAREGAWAVARVDHAGLVHAGGALALVREVMRLLGGDVLEVGQGREGAFVIRLPARGADAEAV